MRRVKFSLLAGMFVLILTGCVNLRLKSAVWNPPPYYAVERYAEIDGLRLCYLEVGEGNPQTIVFIHGLSGNLESWWDQFEALRDSYHLVVFDLPGHGKSSKPKDFDYSVPGFANAAIGLMDQLKIPKADLVGNGMGGAIAGYIAIHHPERVDKLALSDSAGAGISPSLKAAAPVVNPLFIRWSSGVTSGRQYPGRSNKQRARAEFSASYRGTKEESPYLQAINKSLKKLAKFDFEKELGKIQAKTLIIWGDNDTTIPFKKAKVFHSRIANSELYAVQRGGHTPNMLLPDEFNCALGNFLGNLNLEVCHQLGDTARKEMAEKKVLWSSK